MYTKKGERIRERGMERGTGDRGMERGERGRESFFRSKLLDYFVGLAKMIIFRGEQRDII